MTRTLTRLALTAALACMAVPVQAQPPGDFGGPGRGPGGFGGPPGFGGAGGRGPGGPGARDDVKLLKEYDRDDNGWLNREERAAARQAAKSPGNRGPGGFGPPGGGGPRGRGNREPVHEGKRLSPDGVEHYPNATLYDTSVLRTLFFEFENEDWEQELEDFHGTDVDVPATLVVDGKKYTNVGMRFRGMSSYGMVPTGYKRSFNVSVDLADSDQRLYGYKTLNLLNSAGDPSYMSTVLYSRIANQYIPAPKANHVRVVINGENWGVYVNVQQFNKDFLAEHFDSTKGTRWKVAGNPGADGGLRYLGDDLEQYKQRFEMKSNDGKKAWKQLIKLCRVLNETPIESLEKELESILDIDAVLRFLALDVVLVNSDGYWTRASDYSIFLDAEGQFHLFPHDMNEAFHGGHGPGGPGGPSGGPPGDFGPPRGEGDPGRGAFTPEEIAELEELLFGDDAGRRETRNLDVGGRRDQQRGPEGFGGADRPDQNGGFRRGGQGRGPGGPGGPGHGGSDLDPLVSIDNERMPLRKQLLAIPELRAKYVGYVREIAEKSLDWKEVEPFLAAQSELIAQDVAADTKKLETAEAFAQATSLRSANETTGRSSLRQFFEERRNYLLNYQESNRPGSD